MSIYSESYFDRQYYIREVNRLEALRNDAQLQKKACLKRLENCIDTMKRLELITEHRVWKKEIMKLELAIDDIYEKLRKETKKLHASIYA